jgi:hypothetical protein
MPRVITALALLLGLLVGPSCIIGTWPTPEAERGPGGDIPDSDPIGEEACDDLDDDADGSIDEGCRCSADTPRGCVASIDGQCGAGLQRCVDGVWQRCGDLGPPYSPQRQTRVEIRSFEPQQMTRRGSEVLTVQVVAVAPCAGIQVPDVAVTLRSESPAMRLNATALDNGEGPDPEAGDGVFAAALANPFGPGVPAQTLDLRAEARLGGELNSASVAIPLEEP